MFTIFQADGKEYEFDGTREELNTWVGNWDCLEDRSDEIMRVDEDGTTIMKMNDADEMADSDLPIDRCLL